MNMGQWPSPTRGLTTRESLFLCRGPIESQIRAYGFARASITFRHIAIDEIDHLFLAFFWRHLSVTRSFDQCIKPNIFHRFNRAHRLFLIDVLRQPSLPSEQRIKRRVDKIWVAILCSFRGTCTGTVCGPRRQETNDLIMNVSRLAQNSLNSKYFALRLMLQNYPQNGRAHINLARGSARRSSIRDELAKPNHRPSKIRR